jgi:hypothetical protein
LIVVCAPSLPAVRCHTILYGSRGLARDLRDLTEPFEAAIRVTPLYDEVFAFDVAMRQQGDLNGSQLLCRLHYGRDCTRNYDRDVTGSTGEFNRGGYFSRNQTGF